MLNMNHLPVLDRNALKPQSPDWGRAAGNIEDAKIALEGLKALVHDAVYLDEDAYTGALHASSRQSRLQVCTVLALPCASCFPTWAHMAAPHGTIISPVPLFRPDAVSYLTSAGSE